MVNLEKFSIVDTGHKTKNIFKYACPFDYISASSNILVVTVGDSWTWGSDMTTDDNNNYRLQNHYGNLIARAYNADWLNLGQGGSGNFWMYDRVQELANIIPELHYQRIFVICTLTETGRAIITRQDIDFYNFFKHNSLDEFLLHLNSICVNNITTMLEPFNNVVLRIGTNFVDYLGPSNEFLMPKSWLELMCTYYQIPYTGKCYIVSPWVFDELQQLKNLVPPNKINAYLDLLNSLVDRALHRELLIRSVPDIRCHHPQATSHKLWADYILQNI